MSALIRHLPVGVSTTALALAWARQESAPEGATVLLDHEVSPLGWRGVLWPVAPRDTLSLAVVLRPVVSLDRVDVLWAMTVAAVALFVAGSGGVAARTWWPDRVIGPEGGAVAGVKLETVLGPGMVRAAVVAVRIDLPAAGLDIADRVSLATSFGPVLVAASEEAVTDPEDAAGRYSAGSATVGRRVRALLLPRGEARGQAAAIDAEGRLAIASSTGMRESLPIDLVGRVEDLDAL